MKAKWLPLQAVYQNGCHRWKEAVQCECFPDNDLMTLYVMLCHYCFMFTSHLRHSFKSRHSLYEKVQCLLMVVERIWIQYICWLISLGFVFLSHLHLVVFGSSCLIRLWVYLVIHRFPFLFVFHTSSLFLGVLVLSVTSPVCRHWGVSILRYVESSWSVCLSFCLLRFWAAFQKSGQVLIISGHLWNKTNKSLL